jgi:hypothetical protein
VNILWKSRRKGGDRGKGKGERKERKKKEVKGSVQKAMSISKNISKINEQKVKINKNSIENYICGADVK